MTVLFTGSAPGELGGAAQADTSLTHRDPDFVPVCSKFAGGVAETGFRGTGAGFTTVTPTPSGKYWYHARFRSLSVVGNDTNADGHLIQFYTSNSEFICAVDVSDGAWRLESHIGTTVPIAGITSSGEYVMDVSLDITAGNYTMELYFGGALQATLTWASTLGRPAIAVFDFFDAGGIHGGGDFWYCSEVIVTDGESTIGWRLASVIPAADGFYTAWQGDFTGVQTLGDGKGISTAAVGDKESWTFGVLPAGVTGSATVRGVFQSTAAATGVGGPTQIVPFVRVAGTDYEGAAFTPSGIDTMEFAQNPATLAPWTATELANLEVGVKAST